jgi:beta-glucosidase
MFVRRPTAWRCRSQPRSATAGTVLGDEVVQLYLHDVLGSVARPIIELAGFARVTLAPNVSQTVTFNVSRAQLSMLDANMKRVVEPGRWRILVGSSSRDIRLRREVDLP